MGYSVDLAAWGWALLGGLVVITLGLAGFTVWLWKMIGGHVAWALAIAGRRAVDEKLGTTPVPEMKNVLPPDLGMGGLLELVEQAERAKREETLR